MKRTLLTIGALAIASSAGAFVISARSQTTASLPYYGSADLTPQWKETTHRVGAFRLTTQTGDAFSDVDVAGRAYVASFIYTRCSVMCPTLVRQLARLAERAPNLLLVSFSVTPDLDTPDVLAAFGRAKQIDPERWKLVTGDKRAIYSLARESFFASDERLRGLPNADASLLHTERVVLVDATGRIRGVYNGTQPAEVEHLIDDAGRLPAGGRR